MKNRKSSPRRLTAGLLAALLLAATVTPTALAAETETTEFTPACDETYYATLDAYGALEEAGVVKSYRTYGSTTVTDYGVYDEVTNLTNSEEATVSGDTVTFTVPEGTSRFYFEGKTSQPFEELPWTLTVSYKLNGVPTKAEDLAGKTGTVEITLDAVPNDAASEYSDTNLVLIAASIFNGDDILSLEAPGAQVQLLGNLYCVLYAVLPGEEDHYTLSVGSEDFTYDGMIFLAVPATLEQLDKLADLRDAKDKAEDSYHAISDSLDVILNSVDGLGDNMRKTAEGLDSLNEGRAILEDGLPDVYKKLDNALGDVDDLGGSITPFEDHIAAAGSALTGTRTALNQLNTHLSTVLSDEELNGLKKTLQTTYTDIATLKALIADGIPKTDEDGKVVTDENGKTVYDTTALQKDLDALEEYLGELKEASGDLGEALEEAEQNITTTVTTIGTKDMKKYIKETTDQDGNVVAREIRIALDGENYIYTVSDVENLVAMAQAAHAQYEEALKAKSEEEKADFTFEVFLTSAGKTEAEAKQIDTLYNTSLTADYQEQIQSAKELNAALSEFSSDIKDVQTEIGKVKNAASPVTTQLGNLTDSLTALTDCLGELCTPTADLLGNLDTTLALAQKVGGKLNLCTSDLNSLATVLNKSLQEVKSTLEDASEFTDTASDTLDDLARAGKSALRVIRAADGPIDIGAEYTLESLSDALKKAAKGFDQTSTIRNAKDVLTSLIEDEWDEHTGEADNLLLMDNDAPCESMTDSRNTGTASIQYVMRTAEIKKAEEADESEDTTPAGGTTFLSRVGTMFTDIWHSITGIFQKG